MALVIADLREPLSMSTVPFWGPIGRFAWAEAGRPSNVVNLVEDEIARLGSKWPPLKYGLFGGSVDRLNLVRSGFGEVLKRFRVTVF
jgi:hypothetical protein